MKRVNNFTNMVKESQDENTKIKAPKRDYNEVDFNKNRYYQDRERHKDKENETLQKPQFTSKHSEEPKFVELETGKDV